MAGKMICGREIHRRSATAVQIISCIKRGFSRLAKFEKTEFTLVNEYFENECNAENTFLDNL